MAKQRKKSRTGNPQSHAHHYVPEWYQRRFLPPGQTNFFYLDLHPEIRRWNGGSHQLKAVRRRGPDACFRVDDLYTLRFGRLQTDEMERWFFGAVDHRGHDAVSQFAEFNGLTEGIMKAYRIIPLYMGAQRFRTPRGLDTIKRLARGADPHLKANSALLTMANGFQQYTTMWSEGVWEVVRARQSPTKFIVTDDPVTFYCKIVFPSEWTYPHDVKLKQIGTRTLFPLGPDSCLIITHLQLVRNPWSTPTMFRENARSYDMTMKHIGEIQFGRELEQDEVIRINYILKRRATRYVAAAEEAWLYPERHLAATDWTRLDDDWFLFPHPWRVHFTTGIMAGGGKSRPFASDEYGFKPGDPGYQDPRRREAEWETFERAKCEWAKKRIGKSRARVDDRLGRDVSDSMMDDYLREEGLLATS